jgi:hypothetical protein
MLTFGGMAKRGFQDFKVSKVTETSKQLDVFMKLKFPRCVKPLLPPVFVGIIGKNINPLGASCFML